ncbi:hypothetical protein ABW636_21220 [Aquimarina sp. 2201CG1-2-11]|uniref:hypothetical protein n=1 Tax=Aquimarina discodermiae TaxID=3231043 RepID=UPI0034628CDD
MKKKLEAELISIAHRILQLKDTATLSQLQEEARELYEKIAILNFAETHFKGPQPTIGQIRSILDQEPIETPDSHSTNEIENANIITQKVDITPSNPITKAEEPIAKKETTVTEPVSTDPIPESSQNPPVSPKTPEIVIEEINARVTEDLFIRADRASIEELSDEDSVSDESDRPKSLNDQLKKEIHIGLNDRLAFIKYLFEGSATDYNRVLSQLGTINSKTEAKDFINNMIKPDYNNWKDKEEYEERFMDTILSKYDL